MKANTDDAIQERRIPVHTPHGTFSVWTQTVGRSPRIKLLLLHGGPGATHEYFEVFEEYLPQAGVEFIYYDQLGSHLSDKPAIPALWDLTRFVDEVEQVRIALDLDASNFFLLGHSWGGILATEYALAHQKNLKGLIISNMMSSIPEYNAYAERVLMPTMDPDALAQIKAFEARKEYANPQYMQLLIEHHYVNHVVRLPHSQWPDAINRTFAHLNADIYIPMQGPSELGASGALVDWDRFADLRHIDVPTLCIGARHDTMDPAHMERMAAALPRGSYLACNEGSHMAMYDDTETYLNGLIAFLKKVDAQAGPHQPGK
jgi:proline iminopeptidase